MELTRTQRGGALLLLDGFSYTKKVTNKSTIRWGCANRAKESCPAGLTTDLDISQVVSAATTHSHLADSNRTEAAKLRVELRERAVIDRGNPSQTTADVMTGYNIDVRAAAGSKNTIKRALRRVK